MLSNARLYSSDLTKRLNWLRKFIILVFFTVKSALGNYNGNTLDGGVKQVDLKKMRFSISKLITAYLGNGKSKIGP